MRYHDRPWAHQPRAYWVPKRTKKWPEWLRSLAAVVVTLAFWAVILWMFVMAVRL